MMPTAALMPSGSGRIATIQGSEPATVPAVVALHAPSQSQRPAFSPVALEPELPSALSTPRESGRMPTAQIGPVVAEELDTARTSMPPPELTAEAAATPLVMPTPAVPHVAPVSMREASPRLCMPPQLPPPQSAWVEAKEAKVVPPAEVPSSPRGKISSHHRGRTEAADEPADTSPSMGWPLKEDREGAAVAFEEEAVEAPLRSSADAFPEAAHLPATEPPPTPSLPLPQPRQPLCSPSQPPVAVGASPPDKPIAVRAAALVEAGRPRASTLLPPDTQAAAAAEGTVDALAPRAATPSCSPRPVKATPALPAIIPTLAVGVTPPRPASAVWPPLPADDVGGEAASMPLTLLLAAAGEVPTASGVVRMVGSLPGPVTDVGGTEGSILPRNPPSASAAAFAQRARTHSTPPSAVGSRPASRVGSCTRAPANEAGADPPVAAVGRGSGTILLGVGVHVPIGVADVSIDRLAAVVTHGLNDLGYAQVVTELLGGQLVARGLSRPHTLTARLRHQPSGAIDPDAPFVSAIDATGSLITPGATLVLDGLGVAVPITSGDLTPLPLAELPAVSEERLRAAGFADVHASIEVGGQGGDEGGPPWK